MRTKQLFIVGGFTTFSIMAVTLWLARPDQELETIQKIETEVTATTQDIQRLDDTSNNTILTMPPQFLENVMVSQVEELKPEFNKILNGDTVRLTQLVDLLTQKLQRDASLHEAVTASPSADSQRLLNQPDHELSQEQLYRKLTLLEANERQLEQFEENQIEFEDSLRELLSDTEFSEFRALELSKAEISFRKEIAIFAVTTKINTPNLNEYQLTEIDRLVEEYENRGLTYIPIGSVLGTNGIASSAHSFAEYQQLQQDVMSLLTKEQIEHLESAPSILTP